MNNNTHIDNKYSYHDWEAFENYEKSKNQRRTVLPALPRKEYKVG